MALTITSPSVHTVVENQPYSATPATNAVTWSIRTAAENAASVDASQFELSGSTLRWAANATRNFESPTDANGDNVYVAVIRATDAAGNFSEQTISATVTNIAETATVSRSLAPATTFSAAKLAIAGQGEATLANATTISAAALSITGTKVCYLADLTTTSSASVLISGQTTRTLVPATAKSAARVLIGGQVSKTLIGLTSVSSGILTPPIVPTVRRIVLPTALSRLIVISNPLSTRVAPTS